MNKLSQNNKNIDRIDITVIITKINSNILSDIFFRYLHLTNFGIIVKLIKKPQSKAITINKNSIIYI